MNYSLGIFVLTFGFHWWLIAKAFRSVKQTLAAGAIGSILCAVLFVGSFGVMMVKDPDARAGLVAILPQGYLISAAVGWLLGWISSAGKHKRREESP